MPAALDVDWDKIKLSCVAGMSYKEAGAAYGVEEATVRQRSHREQWPVPERVSRVVTRVAENVVIAEKMAENWAEKGEIHRALAFKVAQKAMREAEIAPPEVKDWADVERIDKMARRAAGLDTEGVTVNNSFSFGFLDDGIAPEMEADVREIPPEMPQDSLEG